MFGRVNGLEYLYNVNKGEYSRRNVLSIVEDDLYYTGWIDCFEWLISK